MSSNNEIIAPQGSGLVKTLFFLRTLLKKIDWAIPFLIAMPLIILSINETWLFAEVVKGYIDPWCYFGHFLDLKQHLNTFSGTYYGTRLPWILPGFLVFRLFPPLIANYVLHLTFYYTALISLYLIIKHTVGKKAGLLTSILVGSNYYFLSAFGSQYVDGAGITYLLLTLLTIMLSIKSQYFRLNSILAGISFGCLIFTNLFLVVYTPLIIVFFLFLRKERAPLSLRESFKFFAIGFVGLSLLLCTINYLLNGVFFFFMNSMQIISYVFKDGINPWWKPINEWFENSEWLIFHIVVFLGASITLSFYRQIQQNIKNTYLLFFQGFFILNLIIYLVFEFFLHQPVLEYHFYTSYIFPTAALALAGQLAIALKELKKNHFRLLLISITLISISSHAIDLNTNLDGHFFHSPIFPVSILFLLLGGFLCYRFSNYLKTVLAFSICLSLIIISIFNYNVNSKFTFATKAPQKTYFLACIDSFRAVQAMDPKGNTFFWYNANEKFGEIHRSLCSCYLWGYRLINEEFPKLDENIIPQREPQLNDQIFLISTKDNNLQEANATLAQIGLKGKLINQRIIKQDDVRYKISLLEIVKNHADY